MRHGAGELDFADFLFDLNIINLFLLKEPIASYISLTMTWSDVKKIRF